MITLWGRDSSINVQKVMWCLDELGLAHERKDAGGAFGYPADYAAMNPNPLVPTLEEDGFTLWESNVIVRYLCAKHAAGTLYPEDLRVRADAERWMDWQTTNATAAMRDVFWNLVRLKPEERDAAATAKSTEASESKARILDAHLATRPYMAGDTFTMADIPIGLHLNRWYLLPIERPDLPHARAYCERVRARPGAKTVMALPLT
ncbi:glutathione S-transferase family protein [Enterovirga rhinocerotis]|uniref:Glutathione S-transferase n=1 Tax=Enterovirga rhinocerotis TaxID=1339210 RepID=A0A4R7CBM1_9HYPH|nr:glutathione S-transferase [Enterovirga rhinocerotis]TDR94496.1 glutathione S-transferase [Enterovirga rhinocerotis]